MSKKITLEKTKNEIRQVVCRSCDNATNHIVCNSAELYWVEEEAGIQGRIEYELIRCMGCDQISFRVASSNSEDYDRDEDGDYVSRVDEEIYPSRLMGRLPIEYQYVLPGKISSIYRETHVAICTKLKILAGVGIRALIEVVCTEENAEGQNLEQKIDDLVKKEILTKANAIVLHKTRILGNKAAHEVEAPSDSELDVAFDIVENLLETVYIIPKKAERLKQSL